MSEWSVVYWLELDRLLVWHMMIRGAGETVYSWLALSLSQPRLSHTVETAVIMEVETPARNSNGLRDAEICAEPEIPKRSDVKVYKEFCDFYVRLWVCGLNVANISSWAPMRIQLQYLWCWSMFQVTFSMSIFNESLWLGFTWILSSKEQ